MLCLCATLASTAPILLAVVDPADGTAWRADGTPTENPLPKGFLEANSQRRDLKDPLAHRLFVFRWKTPKDGWTSADIPVAKCNEWPTVFPFDVREDRGDLMVFSQELKPETTTANFDLRYTTQPRRTIFELSVKDGKATVEKGSEYKPQLFASQGEVERLLGPSYQGFIRLMWTPKTKSVIRYNTSKLKDWVMTVLGVYRTDGTRVVEGAGSGGLGDDRYISDPTSVKDLARITVEGMPFQTLAVRGAAENPTTSGGQP